MSQNVIKVEITHKTILFTLCLLIGMFLVYQILDILLLLFVAILFTAAINPFVTRLESWKVPRQAGILIAYLLVFGFLTVTIAGIVPQFINQLVTLINQINLPPWLTKELLTTQVNLQDLQIIANQLNSVPRLLNVVFSAFSTVIVFFSLLVVSFYLLMERPRMHKYLMWMFSNQDAEKRAELFVLKLEEQIGSWVRGEFLLMFVVGLLTYVGLVLLGIPYALPLAIIAGILELLPNIGPTVAAIPAIIVAYLNTTPTIALAVTALYILVQQLENNFIVPYIMRKAVGLNPIVTIFLIMIGFRLGGVGGAILAIPLFLVAKVVVSEGSKLREKRLGGE